MQSIKDHHAEIVKASRWQVIQLAKKNPVLSREHREDWNNDIYVQCLAATPKFDPAKSTMATYYKAVAANAAIDIGRGIAKELGLKGYRTDIDHRIDEEPCNDSSWEMSDLREIDCLSDFEPTNSFDLFATVQFKLDLRKCILDMKPKMESLYSKIIYEGSTLDARKQSGLSRQTFHDQCKALRLHMQKWGFWSPRVQKLSRA